MRITLNKIRALPPAIKAAIVTALALALAHVALYDLTSVSFFSPMEKVSDFRFSDFYALVADSRPVKELDGDIVVVAVDGCRRPEIARALTDIDFCDPAAVGLDIAFSRPADPESDPLTEALASCRNLVMPVEMTERGGGLFSAEHISWYDSVVSPSRGFAAVNIQGDKALWTAVREFRPFFPTSASDTVMSLPAALAAIKDPESRLRLAAGGRDEEAISYCSRLFTEISADEILDNQDAIEGKIVLVGKLRDGSDLHPTPLENFVPGLLIQAYTTATILSGDFTRRLSEPESMAIAAVVCFFVAWLNIRLRQSPAGSLAVRIVQVALLYLMILIGTQAYIHLNIDLNFAFAILTTTLSVAACDIIGGIFEENALLDKSIRTYHKIHNHFLRHDKKPCDQAPSDSGHVSGDSPEP